MQLSSLLAGARDTWNSGRNTPAKLKTWRLGEVVPQTTEMWSNQCERRAAEMRQRNERDRLASHLGHEQLRIAEATGTSGALERHYSVKELGEGRNLSGETITRTFRDEPGVLRIGHGRRGRTGRSHITLRIPESAVAHSWQWTSRPSVSRRTAFLGRNPKSDHKIRN